jgi:hypothetical protein
VTCSADSSTNTTEPQRKPRLKPSCPICGGDLAHAPCLVIRPRRRQRYRPAASWTREPTPPERTRRQSDQSKRYDGACVPRPTRAGSEEGRALAARAAALRAATRRLSRSFFLRWRSLRHRRVDRDPLPTARAYRRALAASPKARSCKTNPLGANDAVHIPESSRLGGRTGVVGHPTGRRSRPNPRSSVRSEF